MTPISPGPNGLSPTVEALEKALEQGESVKAKAGACADELAEANNTSKTLIDEGITTLPTVDVLQSNEAVASTVKECADELHDVTQNLTYGVDEVKALESALTRSKEALAEPETALARSRDAERSANQQAMHDAKTGLPNRTLFDDRLAQAIAGADRQGWMLAVLFLDLNRFKLVNDTHGHAAGDVVLMQVAQRLQSSAREVDTVCRNGGDEFLYLLINPKTPADVASLAGQVFRSIAEPIAVDGMHLDISASIGIALYPAHGDTADLLITRADAAMYRAKRLATPYAFFATEEAPSRRCESATPALSAPDAGLCGHEPGQFRSAICAALPSAPCPALLRGRRPKAVPTTRRANTPEPSQAPQPHRQGMGIGGEVGTKRAPAEKAGGKKKST